VWGEEMEKCARDQVLGNNDIKKLSQMATFEEGRGSMSKVDR